MLKSPVVEWLRALTPETVSFSPASTTSDARGDFRCLLMVVCKPRVLGLSIYQIGSARKSIALNLKRILRIIFGIFKWVPLLVLRRVRSLFMDWHQFLFVLCSFQAFHIVRRLCSQYKTINMSVFAYTTGSFIQQICTNSFLVLVVLVQIPAPTILVLL